MPTTYAHYRLGCEVIKKLPKSVKETVLSNRGLFDIGVHGPDIFFYHNPLIQSDLVRLGNGMHHETGAKFFKRAAAVVRKEENKEAHKAYLFGFLCHFALDVTCHGYIDEMIQKTGISHFEIEAEYDRELLKKDGYEAVSQCLTGHLHATTEHAAVIADFFKGVSQKQVKQTIKRMIFCLDLLCAPSKIKRTVLFGAMKIAGVYDFLHGLVINYQENPACRESTDWLMEHFEPAVLLAVELILEYEEYIKMGGTLSETFLFDFESNKGSEGTN